MSTPPWTSGPPPPWPPGPQPAPSTGALPWALGLVAAVFLLPFVSSLVACGLMIGVGLAQRSKGPLAAANGRRAASWGLTYLLATLVLVPLHFVLLWQLARDGPPERYFPLLLPLTLWGVVTLVHVVVSLAGAVAASKGRVARIPAIPFFRVRSG